MPTAITGDMHSVNKANFAILYWFGPRFEPRFTAMDKQLKELYCADDPAVYEKYLIRPVGHLALRVAEAARLGYRRILVPPGSAKRLPRVPPGASLFELEHLGVALERVAFYAGQPAPGGRPRR